jgi:hypothetical protein
MNNLETYGKYYVYVAMETVARNFLSTGTRSSGHGDCEWK